MSYAASSQLQAAIFEILTGDSALGDLVGTAIYDVLPAGALPSIYVTLGDEDVQDASDSSGSGVRVRLVVSVLSDTGGYLTAKAAGAAIKDALLRAEIAIPGVHLVGPWFIKSTAKRTGVPDVRRLDLSFDALIHTLS